MDDLDLDIDYNEENIITRVTGMYKDWFLDYASYVILERAVPSIRDGFKPVQRRIMQSMKDLDDGRYNKVANIVGHTMQYHPHGDASIADAMVQIGQKNILIDTQGNWGNILTGDRAAASDIVFNPKVTAWQASYDGRRKEPINLPVKFPLLLAQGAEGIAVGLSTKILSHNFVELIDASINCLKNKRFTILPDLLRSIRCLARDCININGPLKLVFICSSHKSIEVSKIDPLVVTAATLIRLFTMPNLFTP